MLDKSKLKLYFGEILKGFSKIYHKDFGVLFVKHINNISSADIDIEYDMLLKESINKGLPDLKTREEFLYKEGLWNKENDKTIKQISDFIQNLHVTKSKLFKKNDIDEINEQIKKHEQDIYKLKSEKNDLIGYVAEHYVEKKINEFYIFTSFFKDKELKYNLFSNEEFNELSENSISKLIQIYNENELNFSSLNLQRISLLPFFLNFFYLCNDDPYIFYGKPVAYLTFHQMELFGYGKFFKNILSDSKIKITDDLIENPDKITEMYNAGKNVEKIMSENQKENTASSLVGATKDDMIKAGVNPNSILDINEEMKKRGGKLTMEDFAKLMGS